MKPTNGGKILNFSSLQVINILSPHKKIVWDFYTICLVRIDNNTTTTFIDPLYLRKITLIWNKIKGKRGVRFLK